MRRENAARGSEEEERTVRDSEEKKEEGEEESVAKKCHFQINAFRIKLTWQSSIISFSCIKFYTFIVSCVKAPEYGLMVIFMDGSPESRRASSLCTIVQAGCTMK